MANIICTFFDRASRSAAAALALASTLAICFLNESVSAASPFCKEAACVLAACGFAHDDCQGLTTVRVAMTTFQQGHCLLGGTMVTQ